MIALTAYWDAVWSQRKKQTAKKNQILRLQMFTVEAKEQGV